MKRPRPALVVLLLSLLVVVAVPLGIWWSNSQAQQQAVVDSVGSRDLDALASMEASGPATESASPEASTGPGGPWQSLAALDHEAAQPLGQPVRLEIPAMSVDAKVLPVGLDKARAVDIPEDITKIGWYKLGVPPGAYRGSAVLVGHRDGRVQGHGAFYELGTLKVGDKVTVTDSFDRRLTYRVVARESILKKRLPYEELFSVNGSPRLTLISCGGYYDPNNGGYQDNVVVTAIPDYSGRITSAPSPSALAEPRVQGGTVGGSDSVPLLLDGRAA